jgi:hypothetical protein
MRQDYSLDPGFEEYLGPDTHKRLLAVTAATAQDLAEHSGSHAITKLWALAGYSAVRAQLKIAQDAFAKRAAFLEAVGAQAIGASRQKKVVVGLLLAIVAFAEANLAFPGIRFSLGRLGNINSPIDDPLSLSVGLIIGLVSVAIAHLAGNQLSWSERSLMKDPEEPEVHHHHLTPLAVQTDEPGDALVLEVSPLSDFAATVNADPLADPLDVSFPMSAEVRAEAEQRQQEAKRRLDHVLRAGRSRRLSRAIGAGLVACGIGLWTVSGMMRVSYLSHIRPENAPVTGGILGSTPPSVEPTSLMSGPIEAAIIVFSILLFLASVAMVFALYPPAQLRAEELLRHQETEKKRLLQTIEAFEKRIRDHEDVKSAVELDILKGTTTGASERIVREDF